MLRNLESVFYETVRYKTGRILSCENTACSLENLKQSQRHNDHYRWVTGAMEEVACQSISTLQSLPGELSNLENLREFWDPDTVELMEWIRSVARFIRSTFHRTNESI